MAVSRTGALVARLGRPPVRLPRAVGGVGHPSGVRDAGAARGELRLVVAHLAAGCSVTAVDGGRSVATSMGMTPLEGLMMGTRGLVGSIRGFGLALLRDGRLTLDELADALDHRSGLLAVAGTAESGRSWSGPTTAKRTPSRDRNVRRATAAGIAGGRDLVVGAGRAGVHRRHRRARVVRPRRDRRAPAVVRVPAVLTGGGARGPLIAMEAAR